MQRLRVTYLDDQPDEEILVDDYASQRGHLTLWDADGNVIGEREHVRFVGAHPVD